jgi:antibiotic biosynthesis monooxygenase (ABM) superfamily enzyme
MAETSIAVTVFHPPGDVAGFHAWLRELMDSAGGAEGFVAGVQAVHDDARLDWAIGVSFTNDAALTEWLDSAGRAAILNDGQSLGYWRKTSDLVLGDAGRRPPTGIGVFQHVVAAGKENAFVEAQEQIANASVAFPGSEGTVVFSPELTGEWMSAVRFRTERQLGTWMRSTARAEALPNVRSSLTKNFTQSGRIAPFGATVRTEDGLTEITPGWKVAMLVLLAVYPTVMVLSRFLGPVLAGWGTPPWLTLWLSQVVSTALLQWLLVPYAWRGFRRWMDPVDGRGLGTSVRGAVAMLVLYAITLVIFATVKDLQFWDYMD